jgi:hypothetical protein
MGRAEKFRNVSLAVAVGSTVVYWAAYVDNQRVASERQAARATTTRPIPLNGFMPSLRGVLPATGSAGPIEVADQSNPRLLLVVKDTCPGSGVAVPQWIDWIRSSPNRGYSATVVSTEGTNYLSQITDAFVSRGVNVVALRVTQIQEFIFSSGVSVTPTFLALDRHGHVRFVGGMFSDAASHALDAFLEVEELATQ